MAESPATSLSDFFIVGRLPVPRKKATTHDMAAQSSNVPGWNPVVSQQRAVVPHQSQEVPELTVYNIEMSNRRLKRHGFHPKVTDQSIKEYLASWLAMRKHMMRKPLPEPGYFGPIGFGHDRLTLASLLLHPKFEANEVADRLGTAGQAGPGSLGRMLTIEGMASSLTESIFADGLRGAQNFALTSAISWTLLTANVSIWNFVSGEMKGRDGSGVFVAVYPEHKVRDIMTLLKKDSEPVKDESKPVEEESKPVEEEPEPVEDESTTTPATEPTVRPWYARLQEDERYLFSRIKEGCQGGQRTGSKLRRLESELGVDTVNLIAEYPIGERVSHGRQLDDEESAQHEQRLQLCRLTELRKLEDMLIRLNWQCHSIKVLHFEKIPLMDSRLLAIILRACPQATMVGIYNCPLIHFGDIICILDLIYEINVEREAKGCRKIEAFDFFPAFEKGMAYEHDGSAVYGLWWNPVDRERTQRGLYAIILKAFSKAKAMDMRLLFDKDQALQDWLFKVPNLPWSVPMFFDALYRMMDASERGNAGYVDRHQAIWDLRKTVRLGLDEDYKLRDEKPDRYQRQMEKKWFCSSCGYEVMEEMFRPLHFNSRKVEIQRTCAGCELQQMLNQESIQRQLYRQRRSLRKLFPSWNHEVLNTEALLSEHGKPVIQLYNAETASTPILERNQNIALDSLVGLPTLQDLLSQDHKRQWDKVAASLFRLSAFRCVARMVVDLSESQDSEAEEERLKQTVREYMPNGKPDNFNELQAQRTSLTKHWYCYDTALLHFGLRFAYFRDEYVRLFPGDLPDLLGAEAMAIYESLYEKSRWGVRW